MWYKKGPPDWLFLSPIRILSFYCFVALFHFILCLWNYPVIMIVSFILSFLWSFCCADSLSGSFWMENVAVGWILSMCRVLWRLAPFECLGHTCKHSDHTPDIIAKPMPNSSQGDREAFRGRQVFVSRARKDISLFFREYLEWLCKVVDCPCVFWCTAQHRTVLPDPITIVPERPSWEENPFWYSSKAQHFKFIN